MGGHESAISQPSCRVRGVSNEALPAGCENWSVTAWELGSGAKTSLDAPFLAAMRMIVFVKGDPISIRPFHREEAQKVLSEPWQNHRVDASCIISVVQSGVKGSRFIVIDVLSGHRGKEVLYNTGVEP